VEGVFWDAEREVRERVAGVNGEDVKCLKDFRHFLRIGDRREGGN
jgi:hypothetical protein